MAIYTTDPVQTGLLVPVNSAPAMQVNSAPAMYNGSAVGGGVNFSLPSSGSVADSAAQAFAFLNANNAQDQAFLGQTIAGGMNLFNYQISPLTRSLGAAGRALAGIGNASAAYMTQVAAQVPNYGSQNSAYTQQFANNIQYLEQTQSQQANNAIGAIQSISQGSFNTSTTASQQGGGGSFIVTALMEAHPKDTAARVIHASLVQWRDGWVRSNRERRRLLLIYFKVSPQIVSKIRESKHESEIWAYLKHSYLIPALVAYQNLDMEAAWVLYVRMCVDAASIVGVDLSKYRLPEWAALDQTSDDGMETI